MLASRVAHASAKGRRQ